MSLEIIILQPLFYFGPATASSYPLYEAGYENNAQRIPPGVVGFNQAYRLFQPVYPGLDVGFFRAVQGLALFPVDFGILSLEVLVGLVYGAAA